MAPHRLPPLNPAGREILSAIEERLDSATARGLAHAVDHALRDGLLAPGTKLPPIRQVATQLALSPTTVSAAWSLLGRSGTIRTDGRRGTRVCAATSPGPVRYRRAVGRPDAFDLDLSTGVPDPALLPDLTRAFGSLGADPVPRSYLDEAVEPRLLALLRADWPYDAEALTVVDGAMDALDLTVRALLRFGDRVVVEHPCFPALADLLEAGGVRVVGVPVDEQGLLPGPLAGALRRPTAAVFLQPRAQNPTGASLTDERARELAAVLDDQGAAPDALVVEDDSAGAIATTPPTSLGRWLPARTVHIRSFSKSHGPDLRLGALSAPAAVMRELLARRQLGQGWTSRVLQRILLTLLTDATALAQVAAARAAYARRRHGLAEALAEHGVTVAPGDGLNLWLPVRDEAAAVGHLAGRGIGAAPGSPFELLPEPAAHLRITSGLVDSRLAELASELAVAARAA
ncbi:aminotransferase class I/II-fold pyridoxal phosphate-dependent enzyme [Streptomyces sp. 4N509B]|uniref:aminotransferase class I/II-fold pyridoxal phosphate-dependent enzyme n=1 Tax=Streptomyces sp. 4N509B TaxID=3457413 RepID=UPI003FD33143